MSDLSTLVPKTVVVATPKGAVTVRELVVEDLQSGTQAFISLFSVLDGSDFKTGNELAVLLKIGRSTKMMEAFKELLCALTDQVEGFYDRLPLGCLAKIVKAFFEVNELQEIRDAFFALKALVPEKGAGAAAEGGGSRPVVKLSRSEEPSSASSTPAPGTD